MTFRTITRNGTTYLVPGDGDAQPDLAPVARLLAALLREAEVDSGSQTSGANDGPGSASHRSAVSSTALPPFSDRGGDMTTLNPAPVLSLEVNL